MLFNNLIVTTASLSLNVFLKMNDMNDKLAIEPPYGYRSLGKTGKQQSDIALKWLAKIRLECEIPENFRWKYHPLGEYKIGKYFVDGYNENTDTAFEFNGCFFHGCDQCFSSDGFNKKLMKNFGKLNCETKSRLNYIKYYVMRLVVMKECEINSDLLSDETCTLLSKSPLKIRDAMYGGRTSCSVLYKDWESREGKIHHVDFNSLYPSV